MQNNTLYIHLPFCSQKCFYCSFVIAVGQLHRMDEYCDALILEMKKYQGKFIKSIYFGGGTPSLIDQKNLQKIIKSIHENFSVEKNAEISFEVNPKDLKVENIPAIKEFGINRVSLGAQTFDDGYLKYLGRGHASNDIKDTFQILQNAGIKNISMDLMFGFPHQTSAQIKNDIQIMTALNPKHISLYALTIEENSKFFVKNIQLNESEQQGEHYNLVVTSMNKAGFHQYEVSNFARPGFESKHNLNYWQGGDYIGLGVGAHSYVEGRRFSNISKLQDYISKIQQGQSVEQDSVTLDSYEQMMDMLLFGLRMNEGVSLEKIQSKHKNVFHQSVKQKLSEFEQGGFIIAQNNHIKVTDQGRLVLDELCAQLI
jgi:oxygen-independent coproporphyrinogen-3 oxidase